LDLPEPVARALGGEANAARHVLESVVADLYRDGKLARGQVRQILGLTWHETEELLARKGCDRHYYLTDLENDWETNQQIVSKS
jgi:predicted HTH domain antitoxin